jgi:hypothetical protein
MDQFNLGPAPFGTPISFEPHPGAPYGVVNSLGPQNAHLAQPGELNPVHVIPWGAPPVDSGQSFGPSDAQKADYYARQQAQPSVAWPQARQKQAYVPSAAAARAVPEPSPPPQRGRCSCFRCAGTCTCTCTCRDCMQSRTAARSEAAASHESYFWRSFLLLLGATAWCLPSWAIIANVNSPGPIVGVLGGLWFISTWLIAPAGVIYFIAGVCSLAKPRVE